MVDPRIPLLYDYYKVIYNGIIVNNLNIKEQINYNNPSINLVALGKDRRINYFTLLDKDFNKVSDCINVTDQEVNGRIYRYLETANYKILLDMNHTMITEELTYGIELFNLGGYTAIPFNRIEGYDKSSYRLFGFLNKDGKKLKTYSFINQKDFKYIGKYSMDDVIAHVVTRNTKYVEGYIVESKGEGIVNSNILYANGTATGLVYEGELELILKPKRLNSMTVNCITSEQLSEFVKQRTIRMKLENKATHAIMFKCK